MDWSIIEVMKDLFEFRHIGKVNFGRKKLAGVVTRQVGIVEGQEYPIRSEWILV